MIGYQIEWIDGTRFPILISISNFEFPSWSSRRLVTHCMCFVPSDYLGLGVKEVKYLWSVDNKTPTFCTTAVLCSFFSTLWPLHFNLATLHRTIVQARHHFNSLRKGFSIITLILTQKNWTRWNQVKPSQFFGELFNRQNKQTTLEAGNVVAWPSMTATVLALIMNSEQKYIALCSHTVYNF